MATIFTRIANGEIPSYKCAENDDFYAFLDIAPMAKGHTLVIPKHVEDDYIFHLDEKTYEGLTKFAREVAVAIGQAVPCKRVGVLRGPDEVRPRGRRRHRPGRPVQAGGRRRPRDGSPAHAHPPRPPAVRSRHGLPEAQAYLGPRRDEGHRRCHPCRV